MLVDIVAGYTENIRVLDGGRAFTANEMVEYDKSSAPLLNTKLRVMVGNEQFYVLCYNVIY